MGFPVALKIRSPDLTHKSDIGGVVLNIGSAERVRSEAAAMQARIKTLRPEARLDGFLVQPMIHRPEAFELIVGSSEDPVFGPMIMFGQGGTAVELLQDTALELPPLNDRLARALIDRTRISRLLKGYRERKPANLSALIDVLIRVSQLVADHGEIVELDINSLLADASGVVAVDARIRVARSSKAGAARLSIAPYPREFAGSGRLRDGTLVLLRPIRPEDEPLLRELVKRMNPSDLRMRFFVPVKELDHELAARLSQLDYDREMALLAMPSDEAGALGVARYSADPDGQRAEFAVAVRSDCKRRGLGSLLMARLIEVARRREIGRLVGDVLRENAPMLGLCRSLGFSFSAQTGDPATLRVTLALAPG